MTDILRYNIPTKDFINFTQDFINSTKETSAEKTDEEFLGILVGYACTYDNIDRHNEIIDKGAFTKWLSDITADNIKNKIKFLRQHEHHELAGYFEAVQDTSKGLLIRVKMFTDLKSDAGVLYSEMIRSGALDSFSVGMRVTKDKYTSETDEKGGKSIRHILEAELLEVSLVSIPANTEARITSYKSIDGKKRSDYLREVKSLSECRKVLKEHFGMTNEEVNLLRRGNISQARLEETLSNLIELVEVTKEFINNNKKNLDIENEENVSIEQKAKELEKRIFQHEAKKIITNINAKFA